MPHFLGRLKGGHNKCGRLLIDSLLDGTVAQDLVNTGFERDWQTLDGLECVK
jgi:hypothetical protein